ncbi:MAG TPA: MOSC N-terminal beta barrel domain-containing protein, partial [Acidimicrobiales bacterium]|nr:MOSC N-terminal beta barrel domain-containing protein [Acidimicrobiales bacterium]
MAHVAQLYRYPVKSMQGEPVDRLEFADGAAVGDRRLALADAGSGVYLSAKRHGQLLEASARTEPDGSVVISLPDGV